MLLPDKKEEDAYMIKLTDFLNYEDMLEML